MRLGDCNFLFLSLSLLSLVAFNNEADNDEQSVRKEKKKSLLAHRTIDACTSLCVSSDDCLVVLFHFSRIVVRFHCHCHCDKRSCDTGDSDRGWFILNKLSLGHAVVT